MCTARVTVIVSCVCVYVCMYVCVYVCMQARSKLKWSGKAKHCMAQLKVRVLLGGSGGMPPGKCTNSMP